MPRRVLVTGCSTGIGLSIAHHLAARRGVTEHRVMLDGLGSAERLRT